MTQTIIIGAGIAGLAAAWRLSARGVGPIVVLERESLAFSHSSARNAAIFRSLEERRSTVRLVRRSKELLTELSPEQHLVRRTGLCLTATSPSSLERSQRVAVELNVEHEALSGAALVERCPALEQGRARFGLWLPDGGVLDVHQLSELLRRELRRAGVQVRLSAEVRRLTASAQKVTGAELSTGEHVPAEQVVIGAGAWAAQLGTSVGAPLPLTPHRRHLALLLPTTERRLSASHPIVWNVETGVYFRPESGGILACPGDHEPTSAGLPLVSETILSSLARDLPRESSWFESYAVARPWACLRTMTDTHETVLGPDPRVAGLYWLAGLGGHGMSAGLGAADYLASTMLGQSLPAWASSMAVAAHLDGARAEHATGATESP
jgi:D-arginine dehydrogenase